MKGYDEVNKPFDVIALQNASKKSTPKSDEKGVETLRKYCYRRNDNRWEYSRL